MLLEIAEIEVKPGKEDEFAANMRNGGLSNLAACEGAVEVSFGRGVENPSKFVFHVIWASMDAHAAARDLPSFGQFRAAFGDLTIGGAMSHYQMDAPTPAASA